MERKKISYQYRVSVPVKSRKGVTLPDGTPYDAVYETVWVDGSETCDASQVDERLAAIDKIIDKDFGGKRYRNIKVE